MKTIKIYNLNNSELLIPDHIKQLLHSIFRWHQREFSTTGEIYLEYSNNNDNLKLELILKAENYEFENIWVTLNSKESDDSFEYLFNILFECICGGLYKNMIKNKIKE